MGLDITFYATVRDVHEECSRDKHGETSWHGYMGRNEELWTPIQIPAFAGREAPIRLGRTHLGTDTYCVGFSYGGYSRWRETLARACGYQVTDRNSDSPHSQAAWDATGGPCWELINFADNEGTIGSRACAKIARDMIAVRDAYAAENDDGDAVRFDRMLAGFLIASHGGAANFH